MPRDVIDWTTALRSQRVTAPKPVKDYWGVKGEASTSDQDKPITFEMFNKHGDKVVLRGVSSGPLRYFEMYNGSPSPENMVVRFCVNNYEVACGREYQPAIGVDDMGNRVGVSNGPLRALKELFTLAESTPAIAKNDRYREMIRPTIEEVLKVFKDV